MHHGKSMFLLIEDFDNVMAENPSPENYSIADRKIIQQWAWSA